MKKSLFIVASLLASSALVLPESVKAGGTDLFSINAAQPGTVTFSGQGTANFNNSLGTSNSFQVGSSTNLGVNASSSSTPEYGVTATAQLDLGSASRLTQVIGTSGNDATNSRTHERAHTVTRDVMREAGWSRSWNRENTAENSSGDGKTYATEAEWNAGYKAAYSAAYENAYTATNSQVTAVGAEGTISGKFKTVETGRSTISGSSGDWESSALAAVDVEHGSTWNSGKSTQADGSAHTEVSWNAARSKSYDTAYANAAANSNRTSDSTVEVKGIGSDASLQADDTSTFVVNIAGTGQGGSSTATSNGSAGANLATSSFANQSNSSTASGFMQAFGGV